MHAPVGCVARRDLRILQGSGDGRWVDLEFGRCGELGCILKVVHDSNRKGTYDRINVLVLQLNTRTVAGLTSISIEV